MEDLKRSNSTIKQIVDDTEDDNIIVENEPDNEDVTQEINNIEEIQMQEKEESNRDILCGTLTDEELKNIPMRFENALILNEEVKPNNEINENNPNDYIIKPRPKIAPFLLFINPKSGGQLGDALFKAFKEHLHAVQVRDLSGEKGPKKGLTQFSNVANTRVIACGGDGTAGWVLSILDTMNINPRPPVGVIPLGTGNDLARTLGWGGGFDKVNTMKSILKKLEVAEIVHLDRWKITFDGETHGYLPVVNNYFSIGIDAKIAYKFHEKREANPENFNSQTMNKIKYGAYGATESVKGLEKDILIKIDGKEIKVPGIQGIIILNLPSWAGGTDLWNFTKGDEKKGWKENLIDDGLFEVVGIKSSMHIARIKGKISRGAIKIGQGKKLEITLKGEHYCQIDGEPWKQTPCKIEMVHFNKVPMLKKKNNK